MEWEEWMAKWLRLLDAVQPASVQRGGVRYPDPLASPFGDVIEGVGTPNDVRRELKRQRQLFAELYGGRDWWKTESEGNAEMNEREVERRVLEEVRAEREERRLADARTKVTAALDALGEDTYTEHAVLRFTKTFNDTVRGTFTYAAIKTNDRWYLTGRVGERHAAGLTWDELTLWLVSGTPVTELTVMTPAQS